MSMRETTVPKSFEAQRTKAKTLPGAKLSDAAAAIEDRLADVAAEPDPVLDALLDPGQFDMGETASGARARVMARASAVFGELAREQVAQHVGDGHAALEGGDLDPAAQLRRDVDGQPGGVEIAHPRRAPRSRPAPSPSCRRRRAGRRSRAWMRARSSHEAPDFGGQRGDLARGGTGLVDVEDEAAGARGVGEDDALADRAPRAPADRARRAPRRSRGR